MEYFGELYARENILELYWKTSEAPEIDYFLIAKGADLKVVEKKDLANNVLDGWRCELNSIDLIADGICFYPTTREDTT